MAPRKQFELLFLGAVVTYTALIFLELQYKQPVSTRKSPQNRVELYATQGTTNIGRIEWPSHTMKKEDLHLEDLLVFNDSPSNVCPERPKSLLGKTAVDLKLLKNTDVSDVEFLNRSLNSSNNVIRLGGWWRPSNCVPKVKVAVLVPYRKRPEQLSIFLRHMHPVFQRQQLSYRVFLIEQAGNTSFNKGAIYNIGFNSTLKYDDYDCYIFHDVDLLCENDFNYYGCEKSPLHMSVAIDKFKYRQPYRNLFGGIQAFKKDHYIFINGYSNRFWGWGAEDDNLRLRVEGRGFKIARPSLDVGRYTMNQVNHFRSDSWSQVNALMLRKKLRMASDGLNNINTLKFTKNEIEKQLYTLISIDLIRT